jgi:hypothetical protein
LLFHFTLALVACRFEQLAMILFREVRSKERDRRQRNPPFCEQVQDDRKFPRRPRRSREAADLICESSGSSVSDWIKLFMIPL